ncbi:MAG: hypothetical protein ACFB5Z_05545 [Elainellaceae cyanobacterium]
MASSTLSIWQHIRESVRLLYWIFLKPFTLKQYLSKIHPGLEPDDDPFKHKDEFDSNLALKRYAEHGWWLSIAAPAGALLLSACITLLITRTFVNIPFNASMAVGFSLSPLVRRYRWRAIGNQLGEVPQVYIAGPRLDVVSAGDRFKGRQDLFREIESLTLAAQPPTLLLYGGRRTGKSSMLSYLPRRVGAEIVPLHVDLQMAASATTLRGIAESIVNLMVEAAHKARNIRLPYPDEDAIHRDPFPAMERWFAEIERAIRGKRFLLCLDEFERLEEVVRETGSRAPLNFFRYVLQNRPQWILLFSGSHTLNELEPYWSDYLINTRPIRVSYLQEADARELIQKPVPEFPDIYEPDAVDAILRLTHCQPYLVQLTCSTLIDHLNRGGNPQDKRVTRQDIEAVKNEILEQASANLFKDRYRTLTDAEQQCLEQLIHHPTADSTDRRSLKRLVQEREVLQRTGTRFSFQVPLFELYVRSRYDFDDVPLA